MSGAEDPGTRLPGSGYPDPPSGPMRAAVHEAARIAEETGGLGRPGRPVNRRSPFFIGMTAAAGVAVTAALVELVLSARTILILIGVAVFIAAGLDPAVSWLIQRRLPRWAAVVIVLLLTAAVIGGFLALAIPVIIKEATALAHELPHYAKELQNHNSELGKLNTKYKIQQRVTKLLQNGNSSLIGGVIGAGKLVLSTASEIGVVSVLSIYFLAALPKVKLFAYRLVPYSRRPRTILITDEIFAKVGGYVLGNLLTSLIAGLGTYLWMVALGIPYPFLLALSVALLDLIPVIGSTIGGALVALTALAVSVPVAIATVAFYIAYRLAEDYLIVPRVIGRTVQVPALATLIAVLVGGVLLGIVGALVAIPAAAAIRLILQEVAFPRLDRS